MKSIPLTQGKFAVIDDEYFDEINKYKWYATYSLHVKGFYAVRNSSRILGKRKLIFMHRVITNAPNNMHVDHIDRDTLNNRRENLRFATNSQNHMNRGKQSNNTSGYKGVTWHKLNKKWQAYIGLNNKIIYLGLFSNPEAAAHAHDEAAKKYHGDYANLNFSESE